MIIPRTIASIRPASHAHEGDGLEIRRPFPIGGLMQVDPFLLLDHFGPIQVLPGKAKGVPPHPHRGFEIITYLIAGDMEHEDSQGHFGALKSGDMQWMLAGDGVLHKEMPSAHFLKEGGGLHGVQLWINLKAADKRLPPAYRDIAARDIPLWSNTDGTVSVKVLAGVFEGLEGPATTRVPILYLHTKLKPGASLTVPISSQWTAFVYGLSGKALIGAEGREAVSDEIAYLQPDGEGVQISASGAEAVECLLLAGQPLQEKMVRYGPFVMNTEAEIYEAFDDFKAGKFGTLA